MNTGGKRVVAVFDFDGTLTTRDSLFLFIRHAVGAWRFYVGMALFVPLMVLMLLRVCDHSRTKERVLAWFFKGWTKERFAAVGRSFVPRLKIVANVDTTAALARLVEQGISVYVVSASVVDWVRPYCDLLGVTDVLATEMQVGSDGRLTGRFAVPNCFGEEKVRRLLKVEPDRDGYYLIAYGDSDGDLEMFALSDEHYKV